MNDEEKLLINRIKDLCESSYTQNRYTFSQFLTVEEQAAIEQISSEIRHADYEFFGGHECCERQMIRFGSYESLSYEEEWPIATLLIEPLIDKFSDDLSHRDFLGALMNLGIKRNVLGDIILKGNSAYVFCLDEVSEYIISELTRIRHTSVKISKIKGQVPELTRRLEDMRVLVNAPRFDAVVAAVTKLSRGKAQELFKMKKVLLNNRICESNSVTLKPGQSFTIRGYGKFIYDGEGTKTKKDRVYLNIRRYV